MIVTQVPLKSPELSFVWKVLEISGNLNVIFADMEKEKPYVLRILAVSECFHNLHMNNNIVLLKIFLMQFIQPVTDKLQYLGVMK